MTTQLSFAFAATLATLLTACSSTPPAPAPHVQPGPGSMGGDVLPPQARSAQPPLRPVNPMLQQ